MPDTPSLTDGRRAIKDPIVENLNVLVSAVPLRYHYIDDSLKVSGRLTKHELEGEGDLLGFDVKSSGAREGNMNLQLDKATDTPPDVGHILKVTKGTSIRFYGVVDAPVPNKRNDVVRIGPSLLQLMNPFFQGLLSADEGDTLRQTYSIATMGTTETITTNPQNHRTGSTKAYSATLEDGTALPTGIAINASTGVITVTKATVSAAVSTIKVVATDTLANKRTTEGEATLVLTITA